MSNKIIYAIVGLIIIKSIKTTPTEDKYKSRQKVQSPYAEISTKVNTKLTVPNNIINIGKNKPLIPPIKLNKDNECCGDLIYFGKAYKSFLNDNNPDNDNQQINFNGFNINNNSAYIDGPHPLEVGKYHDVCVITSINNQLIYKGLLLAVSDRYLIAEGNDFVNASGIINPLNPNYLPVEIKKTKPCNCDCPGETWSTNFSDLEVDNDFILNDQLTSKSLNNPNDKFILKVIQSPFDNSNGVRVKNTKCGIKSENPDDIELEVNNSILVLHNNSNLDNGDVYGVTKICYQYCILGGNDLLIITSGNNFAIESIDEFPEEPFEGCKVNVIGDNNIKKVIIESNNCLGVVAVFGQELFINNLKYCFDKCNKN